jgi:3-isopropylmalate/(R)-2-methylmalate dehydratase large subunit
MGMTMAEKILARTSGKAEVKAGEYVTANIDMIMTHDGFANVTMLLDENKITKVFNTDKVVVLLDHQIPPGSIMAAEKYKTIRDAVKRFQITNWHDWKSGICHQIMPEKGHVLPGYLIIGTDSHTTTYGALGAAATGMGFSDATYAVVTGKQWFRVPGTVKFILNGKLPPRVMSKDALLYIAGKYTAEVAQYKAVEFVGAGATEMSLASRMTMSNMGVEIGAKFAFFEADEKTLEFLKGRVDKPLDKFGPDPDAVYETVYEVDLPSLEPQVAFPHTVDNVKPVSEAGGIEMNQAYIGSCTNARLEDLQIAAEILKGNSIHPDTRLIITPASMEVYREAMHLGLFDIFLDAGAIVQNPTCGACQGVHTGLLAAGERCISSTNRNFKGRMGSPESEVYLASPATVAASAVTGKIADPRRV